MKSKTIMFFCAEVGMAHIVRPLALADELHKRGHKIIFTLSKRKWSSFPNKNFDYINISPMLENKDSIEVIELLKKNNKIKNMIDEELILINKYKPDIIVVDFRPSAFISGYLTKIPTYAIISGHSLPFLIYVPNVFHIPKIIFSKINFIFSKLVYHAIKNYVVDYLVKIGKFYDNTINANKVINYLKYMVAHDSLLFPAQNNDKSLNYIGHLHWQGFNKYQSNIKKNNQKTVYFSFGGTGFNTQHFINIATYLANKNLRVIVSTGTITEPSVFPNHKNLVVKKYFNPIQIMNVADILICHGGLGTIADATIMEKPVLFIPFNPDQYVNALRYQELGLGKYVPINTIKLIFYSLTFKWKKLEQFASEITPDQVYQGVKDIYNNYSSYLKVIKKYNENSLKDRGAENAADLIEAAFK